MPSETAPLTQHLSYTHSLFFAPSDCSNHDDCETHGEVLKKLYCYAFTHIHTCSPNTTTLHMFYYPSMVMIWPHVHAFRYAGITRQTSTDGRARMRRSRCDMKISQLIKVPSDQLPKIGSNVDRESDLVRLQKMRVVRSS